MHKEATIVWKKGILWRQKRRSCWRNTRRGKAALDARVVENDQWYRLRHWQRMRPSGNPGDPEPASAWLLNCLLNKHADAMDNYPEPVVLPREEGDRADAHGAVRRAARDPGTERI